MKAFKAISALILLLGWLVILVTGVAVWFYLVTNATAELGWIFGVVMAIGSLVAAVHWQRYTRFPFELWAQAWRYGDDLIPDR